MGLFGGGGSKLTGVDIGASSVKIVSGSLKGKIFSVEELVIVPLPYKAIDERDTPVMVLIGTDANENDLTGGYVLDRGVPCPPFCGGGGTTNPLQG